MGKKDLIIEIGIAVVTLLIAIWIGYQVTITQYVEHNVWCDNKFGKNNWIDIQVFGHENCSLPWYSLIYDCVKCFAR